MRMSGEKNKVVEMNVKESYFKIKSYTWLK